MNFSSGQYSGQHVCLLTDKEHVMRILSDVMTLSRLNDLHIECNEVKTHVCLKDTKLGSVIKEDEELYKRDFSGVVSDEIIYTSCSVIP